jgi:hypothetical protein
MQGNLFRRVNHYHSAFYSYTGFLKKQWALVTLTLFVAVIFIFSFFIALTSLDLELFLIELDKAQRFTLLIGFELILIFCVLRIFILHRQGIIEGFEIRHGAGYRTLSEAKRKWIDTSFNTSADKYLEFARDIDELLELRNRHKSILSFGRRELTNTIYNSGSSARLTNLFLAFSASIIALSIATLETLFISYDSVETTDLVTLFISLPVMIFIVALLIKFLIMLVISGFEALSAKIDGLRSRSERRASLLIADLIELYQPAVGRYRVDGSKA